jgi:hypothetical protein
MFTAKVKKTGEIFMATNELSPDGVWSHDATELEQGKTYVGHRFLDSCLGQNASQVQFSKVAWAQFTASELERVSQDLRLRQIRSRAQE